MKRSANSAAEGAGGLLRFGVAALADVERIHELSLRVLAETGNLLHYPPARQLLADHGAVVDEARQVVRIPRRLVEQALASAPREVHVYSQADPRREEAVGGSRGVAGEPGSTCVSVHTTKNSPRRVQRNHCFLCVLRGGS
jgi:trimethylamine:corrinoid methyltransferase-like protein